MTRAPLLKALTLSILGLTALPARGTSSPEGPYLCVVEHSTGFSYDKKSKAWVQTTFSPGQKYVLKRVKGGTLEGAADKAIADGDHAVWGVWEFGFDLFGTAFCSNDVGDKGFLWCHGLESIMNFNLTAVALSVPMLARMQATRPCIPTSARTRL